MLKFATWLQIQKLLRWGFITFFAVSYVARDYIPAPKGQIHVFSIKKSLNNPFNGNAKLRHYLFDIDTFCGSNRELRDIIDNVENNTNLVKL